MESHDNGSFSSAPRSSILIELLGLPGAGKTATATALKQELAGQGGWIAQSRVVVKISPETLGDRVVGMLLEVLLHPLSIVRVGHLLVLTRQPSFGRFIELWTNWMYRSRQCRQIARRRVLGCLDQGLWQLMWSIHVTAGDSNHFDALARVLLKLSAGHGLRYIVAFLDISPAAAQYRVSQRLSLEGATLRDTVWTVGPRVHEECLAFIEEYANSFPPIKIIRIDRPEERQAAESAALIIAALTDLEIEGEYFSH